MADRITSVVPVPRAVTVAGRAFLVGEARLCDLAALQAEIDARTPDPAADAWDRSLDPGLSDADRDRILFDALDAAGDGPPAYDEPAGRAWLATAEGVLAFLRVALSRSAPGLTDDDLAALFVALTPGEYAAVRRAFFGSDARGQAERFLTSGIESATAAAGPPLSWGEAVHDVAKACGWTYPEVYALTLTEFRNARAGGKPRERGVSVPPERLADARRSQHLRYCRAYGIDPDPDVTGPAAGGGSPGAGTP